MQLHGWSYRFVLRYAVRSNYFLSDGNKITNQFSYFMNNIVPFCNIVLVYGHVILINKNFLYKRKGKQLRCQNRIPALFYIFKLKSGNYQFFIGYKFHNCGVRGHLGIDCDGGFLLIFVFKNHSFTCI